MPAVLNAANEIAVYAFLEGRIDFGGIPAAIDATLGRHDQVASPALEDIRTADRWARQTTIDFIARRSV